MLGSTLFLLPAPSPLPSLAHQLVHSPGAPQRTLWQTPPTPSSLQLCSGASVDPPAAHTPAPRRLDWAATAWLTRLPGSGDAVEGALVGMGVVAVAAAIVLEFTASRARHQQIAQRLDREAARADEVADVRAATATAEALGKRGRDDLARLREQKVELALAAVAELPAPTAAPTPWSFWALSLALLCNVVLVGASLRRRSPTASALGATAAARLVALETLHARQSEAVRGAERGLDRVQTRVGLLSRDLRSTVRQLQQESLQHATALQGLAQLADAAATQMHDLQRLMEAMQIVSSKQFALLLQALPHLQRAPAEPPQPSPREMTTEPPLVVM